jgi:hypothetical protein
MTEQHMNTQQLQRAFDNLAPSTAARQRMLDNVLSQGARSSRLRSSGRPGLRYRALSIAACLVILVGIGLLVLPQLNLDQRERVPQAESVVTESAAMAPDSGASDSAAEAQADVAAPMAVETPMAVEDMTITMTGEEDTGILNPAIGVLVIAFGVLLLIIYSFLIFSFGRKR